MNPRSTGKLRLGSRVVELLIPHRRPFLMVDHVEAFSTAPTPKIEAGRHVTMNEVYFQGHFPGMPLWPGALTMEGLGQSAVLLLVLTRIHRDAEVRGEDPEGLLEALRNLDRGYRMHPGYQPQGVGELMARIRASDDHLAMGAAVEMKFLRPVFPGCRIDYVVELADDLGKLIRFSAEASVEGEPVARGTITGAIGSRPLFPDEP